MPWIQWSALALSMALPMALSIHLFSGLLDPTNVAWLAREGDSFQHFIGWHFFRREGWGWPLGALSSLASDVPSSIVYTDSIPLIAIPLKVFHEWIPDSFQYLGLVVLLNYSFNGFFAGRLLLNLGVSPLVVPLGALLLASLPAVTMRGIGAYGHEALTAHWIIFIAIEYALLRSRISKSVALAWLGLLVVAVLVHFYLFFMAGVLWFFSMARMVYREKPWQLTGGIGGESLKLWLMVWLGTPAVILFIMWAVGYFQLGGQSAGSGGFGYFSAEFFTFFNPAYTAWYSSGEIPTLSTLFGGWQTVHKGQHEGLAYLGAGVFLLVSVSIGFLALRGKSIIFDIFEHIGPMKMVALAAALMFLFAIAGEFGLSQGNIDLLYGFVFGPLRDYLRSSGRFVWPLMYFIVIASLVILSYSMRRKSLFLLVAFSLWIQVDDLNPWHDSLRETIEYRAGIAGLDPVFYSAWEDARLDEVWEAYDHIVVLPAESYDILRPYMWMAAEHGMSINIAYLARISSSVIEEATRPYLEALRDGNLPKDNVYVVSNPQHIKMICSQDGWNCRKHDKTVVAWSNIKNAQ